MGDFLVFIFTGIFKIIGFLLFKVGMWMPALFTILFFIVLGITGTEFALVSGLFWFGLIATALIGVILAIVFAVKKITKKKPAENNRANQQQVKKTDSEEAKSEEQPPQPVVQPQAPYPYQAPAFAPYPPPYQYYQPPYYAPPQESAPQEAQQTPPSQPAPPQPAQPYQAPVSPQRTASDLQERSSFDRNFRMPTRERSERADFARRPSFEVKREETPRIYRTRKDPNILIYDYSDRVEFYRKTESGLNYLYTERKDK